MDFGQEEVSYFSEIRQRLQIWGSRKARKKNQCIKTTHPPPPHPRLVPTKKRKKEAKTGCKKEGRYELLLVSAQGKLVMRWGNGSCDGDRKTSARGEGGTP